MEDQYEYPEDINDFLIERSIRLEDGTVVIPLPDVRDALEHYYYEIY